MTSSDETQVRSEPFGPGVVRIRLDGPKRYQALSIVTANALVAALEQADAEGVRVVLLTGSAKAFCAGADLMSGRGSRAGVGAGTVRLEHAHRVIAALRQFRGPVIAAVEGACVGVGWSIALACDLVIAGSSAYFLAPFVQRGLVPDSGLSWLLQQSLGPVQAAEIVMFGERMPAEQARELGLVNRVVPAGEVEAFAAEWALRLAGESTSGDALELSKRLVEAGRSVGLGDFLRIEWSFAALGLQGPDAAEGVASFRERRPSRFAREL